MLLFILSFILVFLSSYLITSLLSEKKSSLGFIYMLLVAFAQLVLTFEILSLFSAINKPCVIGFNIIFTAIAAFIWNKKERPLWSYDFADIKNKIINSFKLDKSLIWLFAGFCVLVITAFILGTSLSITNFDAQAYHVARSAVWVLNGNLNHFAIGDIRNLVLPINSEILYAWVILFFQKLLLFGTFSLVGFILSVISVFSMMGLAGFSTRKRLWTVFIFSSFASVITQISGTETDIIIAGLVTSSIFLFWYGLKKDKLIPIFMSALAYALAVGTKTTAIMIIPAVGLFLLWLCFSDKKYKPLGYFVGFFTLNFMVFASYNYVLNFLNFGDIMGADSVMQVTKNHYGIKGLFANFIKYIFMFFDFTGFRWSDYVGGYLLNLKLSVLNFLHLGAVRDSIYSIKFGANRSLLEPIMGAGILGFLVFLPCWIWSLIKPIFKRSKKTILLFAFGLMLFLNIAVISYLLAYMVYSVRFIMSFMVISSPILAYSYFKKNNPLKIIIIVFAMFYLSLVSTHLWARPFVGIIKLMKNGASFTEIRDRAVCKNYKPQAYYQNEDCALRNVVQGLGSDKKYLFFAGNTDNFLVMKMMEFDGFSIDLGVLEDGQEIDYDKYDYIIITNHGQASTYIKYFEERKYLVEIIDNTVIIHKNMTIPCVYIDRFGKNIGTANNKESKPYLVQCFMSKEFIKEKNLKIKRYAGLIRKEETDPEYYIIYEKIKN